MYTPFCHNPRVSTGMSDHSRSSRLTVALIVLTGLLAFAIRLPGLGARSLASAEQRVLAESQGLDPAGPLPEDVLLEPKALPRRAGTWAIARGARSFPVYTGALALWGHRVGTSETALRLPSAVGGALSVALVASIAAFLGGPWAAGGAGLLVALSPIHTLASREVGPMAFGILLLVASLWATLRLDGTGRVGLASAQGLLLGLLATGPPALLALAVLQIVWLARRRENRPTTTIVAGVAGAIVALAGTCGWLCSPLAEGADLGWVPQTTGLGVLRCAGASFTRVAGLEYHEVVSHARYVAPLTLAIVALALVGARRLDPGRRWLLLGGAALPFGLGMVLALATGTVAPLQAHRLTPALPFLATLVGVGLTSLSRGRARVATATVVGLVGASLGLALTAPPRETSPTRALVLELVRCRPPGSVASVQRPLDLYALVAWGAPGPLWLRSTRGAEPPAPGIRIGPRSACSSGLHPACPTIPACPLLD